MAERIRPEQPSPWLFRYALLVSFFTFWLVFAGGLVTSKGAGLSVPDWPLAYGKAMPEGWWQTENVRAEHSHRIIAGVVGILTFVLFTWVWRAERRRWVRNLAAVTVTAVVVQALFGGLTVIFTRPIPVTVGHAVLGQSFFCLTVSLALVLSPWWRRAGEATVSPSAGTFHFAAVALTAIVFLQLVVGAVMRHTQSGLAIHDFPLAFGKLIPTVDEAALDKINFDRALIFLPKVTAEQVWIHFAHRMGAIAVCIAVIFAAVCVFKKFRERGEFFLPAVLLLALVTIQIFLGALTIWTEKQPHIATMHVAIGAATLAASLVLTIQSFRLARVALPVVESVEASSSSKRVGSSEVAT